MNSTVKCIRSQCSQFLKKEKQLFGKRKFNQTISYWRGDKVEKFWILTLVLMRLPRFSERKVCAQMLLK